STIRSVFILRRRPPPAAGRGWLSEERRTIGPRRRNPAFVRVSAFRGHRTLGQHECVSPPINLSPRRDRGPACHQPEAVALDFVHPEFFGGLLFSALRFLVAVLSDLSGCT